jgi:hypothetical protein
MITHNVKVTGLLNKLWVKRKPGKELHHQRTKGAATWVAICHQKHEQSRKYISYPLNSEDITTTLYLRGSIKKSQM